MAMEREGLLKSLFFGGSTVGEIVFRLKDLRIVAANEVAIRLYGYSQRELESMKIIDLSAQEQVTEDAVRSTRFLHSNLDTRRTHRRKDGTEFVAQVGYDRCMFEEQWYFCKYVQDASGAIQTQRLLDESTERFRAVADYTYDWESWIQSDGKLIWVNPAVERLTGFSVTDCFQMSEYPIELVDALDKEQIRQILLGAGTGSSGNDVEFRVMTKTGNVKWFAVSWQPLMDPDGKASSFRMSMRDIADRKRMEQALREHSLQLEDLANRRALTIVELEKKKLHHQKLAAMGQMAASIAHEINNPLAGVKNAIKLVGQEPTLGDSARDLLGCVNKEIDRIAKLVQQFHQLCRPTVGHRIDVDLKRLVREVIASVEAQRAPMQLQVRWVDWPDAFVAELHEPELRQILHNLLLNAFEASSIGQTIQIVFEEPVDQQLVLRIIDQGHGIEQQKLSEVFEPFFTTKLDSRNPGTGLGLAISRSLALAIGGNIEVQSQLGQGTTFLLRLALPEQTSNEKIAADHGEQA